MGRSEEAAIREARVVEGPGFAAREVGPAEPWPGPVAFLDGTQHYHIVAHLGAAPLVVATLAAAVRERRERRLGTAALRTRTIALGRADLLAAAAPVLEGVELVPIPDDEPVHPVRDLVQIRRAVDQERGRLELEVGAEYPVPPDGWLLVDGTLTSSPAWAAHPRTLGVVKSHSILPFGGAELEQYLRLPCGHRTVVFAPPVSRVAPVYSWALRLWPWEGQDLFYGLVRIEARPHADTLALADTVSRWVMAERAPIAAPDARWDRLLYGFRDVETVLRAGPA